MAARTAVLQPLAVRIVILWAEGNLVRSPDALASSCCRVHVSTGLSYWHLRPRSIESHPPFSTWPSIPSTPTIHSHVESGALSTIELDLSWRPAVQHHAVWHGKTFGRARRTPTSGTNMADESRAVCRLNACGHRHNGLWFSLAHH